MTELEREARERLVYLTPEEFAVVLDLLERAYEVGKERGADCEREYYWNP